MIEIFVKSKPQTTRAKFNALSDAIRRLIEADPEVEISIDCRIDRENELTIRRTIAYSANIKARKESVDLENVVGVARENGFEFHCWPIYGKNKRVSEIHSWAKDIG